MPRSYQWWNSFVASRFHSWNWWHCCRWGLRLSNRTSWVCLCLFRTWRDCRMWGAIWKKWYSILHLISFSCPRCPLPRRVDLHLRGSTDRCEHHRWKGHRIHYLRLRLSWYWRDVYWGRSWLVGRSSQIRNFAVWAYLNLYRLIWLPSSKFFRRFSKAWCSCCCLLTSSCICPDFSANWRQWFPTLRPCCEVDRTILYVTETQWSIHTLVISFCYFRVLRRWWCDRHYRRGIRTFRCNQTL